MNILLVEDRGGVFINMIPMLEECGHKVLHAQELYSANAILREATIDCLILDLNVPPDGLDGELLDEALSCGLAGWVWFKDVFLKALPQMKERTLFYTDYRDLLERAATATQLAGITVLTKKSGQSEVKSYVAGLATGSCREEGAT